MEINIIFPHWIWSKCVKFIHHQISDQCKHNYSIMPPDTEPDVAGNNQYCHLPVPPENYIFIMRVWLDLCWTPNVDTVIVLLILQIIFVFLIQSSPWTLVTSHSEVKLNNWVKNYIRGFFHISNKFSLYFLLDDKRCKLAFCKSVLSIKEGGSKLVCIIIQFEHW